MRCSGRLLVLPQQSIWLLWDAAAPADSVDAVKAPYLLVALACVSCIGGASRCLFVCG